MSLKMRRLCSPSRSSRRQWRPSINTARPTIPHKSWLGWRTKVATATTRNPPQYRLHALKFWTGTMCLSNSCKWSGNRRVPNNRTVMTTMNTFLHGAAHYCIYPLHDSSKYRSPFIISTEYHFVQRKRRDPTRSYTQPSGNGQWKSLSVNKNVIITTWNFSSNERNIRIYSAPHLLTLQGQQQRHKIYVTCTLCLLLFVVSAYFPKFSRVRFYIYRRSHFLSS